MIIKNSFSLSVFSGSGSWRSGKHRQGTDGEEDGVEDEQLTALFM